MIKQAIIISPYLATQLSPHLDNEPGGEIDK